MESLDPGHRKTRGQGQIEEANVTVYRLAASVASVLALVAAGAVLVYSGIVVKAFLAGEGKNGVATTFFILTLLLVLVPGLVCVVLGALAIMARGFDRPGPVEGVSAGQVDARPRRKQAKSWVKTLAGWALLWLSLLAAAWFLSVLTEIAVSPGPDDITQLGEVLFPVIVGLPGIPAAVAAWGTGALLLLIGRSWRSGTTGER